MRIRTDGDYAHRKDIIEDAADRLDVNKTRAVLLSADAIGSLLNELEDALSHEDIPPRVAREIAEQVESRKWSLEYQPHEFRFRKK
ncbi:Uncharacterized protein HSRCO_0741 [Halanaeroarchaeum sp. HSR-CO]|uniref:DUF7692 domain-containing protein n=1 Tax=Halanaeroarchaeum sp. HSR-CO TaxID=2866382 RepID=UPI00217F1B73|nr:hypothetical protein [Halanaeroarchaeum sp. HSR-CO]UWG47035.1 Uncharacterized protein HSRCO_0741 [Halanaeroarchaeum sp. HSR-CO]